MIQLQLFELPKKQEPTNEELLKRIETLRKGQWSTITKMKNKIDELNSKIELLEAHICKNGLFLC